MEQWLDNIGVQHVFGGLSSLLDFKHRLLWKKRFLFNLLLHFRICYLSVVAVTSLLVEIGALSCLRASH